MSATSNNSAVTPEHGTSASLTPGSSGKARGRFARVKNTPNSQSRSDKQMVQVVLVEPDAESETSVFGLVISPLGFMMDRFLADCMYKKIPGPWTAKFLKDTECVHRCFDVLDSTGKPLKKENQGKFYPVKSCFLPVEEPNDLKDKEKVTALVNKVADALWQTIDKQRFKWSKESELPRIFDYDRDVHSVKNYSDIFLNYEDSLICMTLACKENDVKFSDWIRSEGDDNVYTLFKHGKVPPEMVSKWTLPFDRLDNQDKEAYRIYKEKHDKEMEIATKRSLATELSQEGSDNSTN